ncbi:MAG: pyridoxamine 5'-phosphate oxidase [Microlunatus sp.]|nr:pyridoxamine 5'-phosphate oxidase [Microlunatus sp.]
MSHDLAAERKDYSGDHLLEATAPADPYALFSAWLEDAFAAQERGVLPEPTAVVISTVSAGGRPSSRTVLLKGIVPSADSGHRDGFTVFTNYDSAKGRDLAGNPAVALLFGWYPLQRQVRVEGTAAKVPAEESDAYFATRPRGSQLGAWASAQSSEVSSLEELQADYAAAERRFAGVEVPRPEHWGGYRISPEMIEFWQGQPSRMHDRLRYRRTAHRWALARLAP